MSLSGKEFPERLDESTFPGPGYTRDPDTDGFTRVREATVDHFLCHGLVVNAGAFHEGNGLA